MDTQTRVYFKNERIRKIEDQTQYIYIDFEKGVELTGISFSEYDAVEIGLTSEDPNAVLKTEIYDTDEIISIKAGENKKISAGGETKGMLVPGEYFFSVQSKGKTYNGKYKITPKNLSWNALLNLREQIEQLVRGISYNLQENRLGVNVDGLKIDPSILDAYKYLTDNFDKLNTALHMIIKRQISDIKKEYKETSVIQQQDNKSLRWLTTKGLRKNQNIYDPDFILGKHSKLTKNTPENQWIKKILIVIKSILQDVENEFYNSAILNTKSIKKLEKDRESRKKILSNNAYVYGVDIQRRRLESDIKSINKEILEINNKLMNTKTTLDKINRLNGRITYYLNSTWLSDVSLNFKTNKVTKKLLNDQHYSIVYKIYKNINKYRKKDVDFNKFTFPYKKTSKLYEYYVVIITINLLRSQGYKWTEGWIHDSTMNDLPAGTVVRLEKSDHYIDLIYDKKIRKYQCTDQESYYEANKHDTPDLLLSLHKKDNELIAALVIEIKCRGYRYMYSNKLETDVMAQIIDYTKIEYVDAVRGSKGLPMQVRGPVKQVIAVYPKQSQGESLEYIKEELYYNDLVFVQFSPPEDNEKKPYGYENLKRLINTFLENQLSLL